MSLRRSPQLSDHWELPAWAGTSTDLVTLGTALTDLIPEGTFQATVEGKRTGERVTTEPGALADLREADHTHSFSMKVEHAEHHRDTGLKHWAIHITVRPSSGVVWVWAPTERDTRALSGGVKEALRPGQPSWSILYRRGANEPLAGVLFSLIVLAGLTWVAVQVDVMKARYWFLAGLLWMPIYFAMFPIIDWLFPRVLVYDERTRVRRFGWRMVTLLLLPFVVGLAVNLTSPSPHP